MGIVREGGQIGIPGLYVTEDPGAATEAAKFGTSCPPHSGVSHPGAPCHLASRGDFAHLP